MITVKELFIIKKNFQPYCSVTGLQLHLIYTAALLLQLHYAVLSCLVDAHYKYI